jgi:hypothetical protein
MPINESEDWLNRLLELAEEAKLSQDCVPLGAHIYAKMLEIRWPIDLHAPAALPPPTCESDADVIRWLLTRTKNRADLNAIYWDLQEALVVVDCSVSGALSSDWDTVIKSPTFGGAVYVCGKQGLARGRRESPLKALRDALQHRAPAGKAPRPPRLEPNSELRNIRFFWRRDELTPTIRKSVFDSGACELHADSRLEEDPESLRIALCPLRKEFHPHFELTPPPARFHVKRSDPMMNPHELKKHLSSIIEAAESREVHLVVLPELTVCQPAREHIARLLQTRSSKYPYAVLASSFHIWKEQGDQQRSDSPAIPVNEAVLMARWFRLLTHEKRGRYLLASKDVTEKFFPGSGLPIQETWVRENIQPGSQLEFLETVFGTIAILICADLIDDEDLEGYLSTVQRLRPDLLLVAAMSAVTEPFQAKAQELSKCGVGTFMVNAACIFPTEPRAEKAPCLAIAHLGLFQNPDPEAPPVFVRWRCDTYAAERWAYDQKTWSEFAPVPESGVSWIDADGERIGLIVAFGAHQEWLKSLESLED